MKINTFIILALFLLCADSTVVTGVMADADDKFVLEKVAEGDYILQFSFIGFLKAYRHENVPEQSDLGDISLNENATRLAFRYFKDNPKK